MRALTFGGGLALVVWAVIGCGGEEPAANTTETRATGEEAATAGPAPGNHAPTIESVRFEPPRPASGESLRAVVDAQDEDGDPLRLGYVWRVDGEIVRAKGPRLDLSRAEKGASVEVTVTATDRSDQSAPATASTQVRNRAPRLSGVRIEPDDRITAGGRVVVAPSAMDPDGDAVDYRYSWWVNGEQTDETSNAFSTHDLSRGDTLLVRTVATDGEDESEPIQSDEMEVANAMPRIVSLPGLADADGVFRYRVVVEDADGDRRFRYQLEAAPEGMTLAANEIEWRPGADQSGRHQVEVVVEDFHGGHASQAFHVDVGIAPAEAAPASPTP